MRRNQNQRGVALIAAMMILVVGVTIATNLLWSSSLQMHRTRNLNNMDQAMLYALGAEAWAADTLTLDLQDSQADSLDEDWAVALPPLPIGDPASGDMMTGAIEDLQGRINVNNLVSASGQKDQMWFDVLVRLLIMLEIDPIVADSVVDWIDPDVEVSFPNGAEDDLYTGLEPPYRTANVFLNDVSELRAVNGFDGPIYAALKPYVTALPRGTLINVNTASEMVLAAISDDVTLFDAQIITENRIGEPFENIQELDSFIPQEAMGLVSIESDYFGVESVVALGTTQFSMYSLLERNKQNAMVSTRLRHSGTH